MPHKAKKMKTLHFSLWLIFCGLIAVSNADEKDERRALIEATIASVKEEFAQKEDAAKSSSTIAQNKLHSFKMVTAESLAQGNARMKFEKMVKRAESSILEKQRRTTAQTAETRVASLAMEILHKPGSILTKQEIARMYQESECHKTLVAPPDCTSMTRQRTANGVCNNLENPTFGAANTPMRRLIPPQYDDGIGRLQGTLQIREVSIVPGPFSPPNPSPRVVSLGVIMDRPDNDTRFSHILMQWGQFMDHDLGAMPEFDGKCPPGCAVEEDSCVPFPVPRDDDEVSRVSNGNSRFCHVFRRSIPACDGNGEALMPREQLNSLSHFIDGSMVYHHNASVQMNLIRNQSSPDGFLNVGLPATGSSRPSLPFINTEANPGVVACPNPSNPCFLAGDFRVNEHTALTVMHTIWVREHNRIAQTLRTNNPQISSDGIFQTTRNIVIAEIQKITYKDFLPILLGKRFRDLIPNYSGYSNIINPNVPNAFASAAYRFGHSQIQPFFERLDEGYKSIPAGPLSLVDAFFDTTQFTNNGGTDPILRGLLTRNARQVDEFLNSILTSHLFSEATSIPGFDLAALNIQRGRDHGLPSYLTWKQWAKERCDMESEFRNQLTQVHLLQVYGSIRNVDLFVGGLAEEPLPGGLVGAVFACIFANTFAALRDGDRFYYENAAGQMPLFTEAQRNEIEKVSLSRVICDNSDITEIQPNAFMASQKRVSCSQLPSVDLSQWSTSSLPELCYIKFNTGTSRRATYRAISRRIGATSGTRFRFSSRRASRMRNECLSFLCPRDDARTRLTFSTSNSCPVRLNMNLRSTSRFNSQYRQTLSAGDIQSTSGLYTSLSSCLLGNDAALFFCEGPGGGDVQAEVLDTNSAEEQQNDEEVDQNLTKEELRQRLSKSGLPSENIEEILGEDSKDDRPGDDNRKLIALMEEVLVSLKTQGADDADINAHKEMGVQETNIMELDEALKELETQ